jgi:F0F1-type ATP synthase membrane subunit c/vacuolar-type H+-ATPase subunit K
MKTTEKVSLLAMAVAIATGFGLHYLLPEMHWGIKLVAGLISGGAAYGGITQQIATDRIVDRDIAPKQKR